MESPSANRMAGPGPAPFPPGFDGENMVPASGEFDEGRDAPTEHQWQALSWLDAGDGSQYVVWTFDKDSGRWALDFCPPDECDLSEDEDPPTVPDWFKNHPDRLQ